MAATSDEKVELFNVLDGALTKGVDKRKVVLESLAMALPGQ
jgi:hypothetical protein